jgi:hypothetical protein
LATNEGIYGRIEIDSDGNIKGRALPAMPPGHYALIRVKNDKAMWWEAMPAPESGRLDELPDELDRE